MANPMFLPKRRLLIAATLSAAFLAACGGGGGSSAPAPLNVTAAAGDEQIFVKWDELPAVEYWMWLKEGPPSRRRQDAVAKVGQGQRRRQPYIFNIVRPTPASPMAPVRPGNQRRGRW
jgi:hypothetical protein